VRSCVRVSLWRSCLIQWPYPSRQLVNNAGFSYPGKLFGHKEAEITLKTNFAGPSATQTCSAVAVR
jgi:hypothetical protein